MTRQPDPGEPQASLTLLDWRRQVAELYQHIRRNSPGPVTWREWRRVRDRLFRDHPQSPYDADARTGLGPLPCFDYEPALQVDADVEAADEDVFEIGHSSDGTTRARRVGIARFTLAGEECELSLFWLEQYGGGLFLPFRDETSGDTTYGGGRYLLDTAKGADLGMRDGRLLLDFNFAYHPSCFHDDRWSCPLAPPENRLPVAIRGGERAG